MLAHNHQTHIVFIDLGKDNESNPLRRVWKTVQNHGISGKYINTEIHKVIVVIIKTGKAISTKIVICEGLN